MIPALFIIAWYLLTGLFLGATDISNKGSLDRPMLALEKPNQYLVITTLTWPIHAFHRPAWVLKGIVYMPVAIALLVVTKAFVFARNLFNS